MTATDLSWRNRSAPRRHSRRRGVLALPLVVLLGLVVGAISFITYLLWPRWPDAPVALDAPALPITVAGVAFNVPPAARERLFVTIAIAGDTLAPAERVRIIYPRYVAAQPVAAADGLAVLAFRDGTP